MREQNKTIFYVFNSNDEYKINGMNCYELFNFYQGNIQFV